jgi:ATP-binding cassette subfamily B protein
LVSNDVKTEEPSILAAPDNPASAKTSSEPGDAAPRFSRGRKFLSYYKPYKGLFLADMACALIVAAITLALPLCARFVTKDILEGGAPSRLNQIALMGALMVALVGVHTLCVMFIDYQGHFMGAKMERDMRHELFEHYQKLSFRFYDEQTTGQLMTRMTNDTFAMSELYHHGPEDIVVTFLTVIGAFIILLRINVALTLLVFLFVPIMAVFAMYFNGRLQRALRSSKDRVGDVNAQLEDTLAGVRVVKSFTNEETEARKFAAENERFLASRRIEYKGYMLFSSGLIGFGQLITIAVVIFGAAAIVRAELDLADLATYLLCIAILIEPIQKLVNFGRLYQEGMTGFQRFMEMLEVAPDLRDAPDAVELPPVRGHIEFRDVSFRYKDDQQYVLKDLSLEIQAGEYVALVGSSGAGKTTLCSLIPRFYDVTAGSILVDGHNVRDVTMRSLRSSIGVVQQDIYLFAGTVAENIGYGKPQATREETVAAAKLAYAHDFITALPDGYDTNIGQRGVRLSGGQKQRLSIARMFLKNPPIIILDEATSALDNESERAVQVSLEKLAENRTTLVIAHRLSTIRNARRIVVLSDSGIAEQGTHAELLALNGAYANLYNMQSKI